MNCLQLLFLSVCTVNVVYTYSNGRSQGYMPMVRLELNVFSGRTNPWVDVPLPFMMNMMKEFPPRAMKKTPRELGYRGFILNNGQNSMSIPGGSNRQLEGRLMRFFDIPMNVKKHCNQQIFGQNSNNPIYTESVRGCQSPQSSTVFDASRWNSNSAVQSSNNCYNYANDILTNTFAQPGRASGYNYQSVSGVNIQRGAELDGLACIAAPSQQCLPVPNRNLIALVIWPNSDYHYYRLDSDGYFSHKPGQTAARNVDNDGAMIRDPRVANRGPYTEFHCFMETSQNSVRIM